MFEQAKSYLLSWFVWFGLVEPNDKTVFASREERARKIMIAEFNKKQAEALRRHEAEILKLYPDRPLYKTWTDWICGVWFSVIKAYDRARSRHHYPAGTDPKITELYVAKSAQTVDSGIKLQPIPKSWGSADKPDPCGEYYKTLEATQKRQDTYEAVPKPAKIPDMLFS